MMLISEPIIKTNEYDVIFKEKLYKKAGYLEGNYVSTCSICNNQIHGVSKHCRICFECACKAYIHDLDQLLDQCIEENEFLRNDTSPFTKKAF